MVGESGVKSWGRSMRPLVSLVAIVVLALVSSPTSSQDVGQPVADPPGPVAVSPRCDPLSAIGIVVSRTRDTLYFRSPAGLQGITLEGAPFHEWVFNPVDGDYHSAAWVGQGTHEF